ncbi:ATP-binding cassette domain-containing protein [Georgenia sp. M64]|uniref:ABC transporter ATP-binding protein n=1 Tax=Georgenia sp. M64 TaxID=3120520 RepID=UPI0030E060B2
MSVELRGVSFSYPGADKKVLDGAELTVGEAESVAVMAPSGQGKSTLLALAGLLLKPSAGEVRINGVVPAPQEATRLLGRAIQWIPQSVNLIPRRSVTDNLLLPALAQGMTRGVAISRAQDLMMAAGLDVEGTRQARTLSGGQAQRVAVARALMSDPLVILADEPTANLDAITARSIARAMFSAAATTTVLVATHDLQVAELADRIVRLKSGKVVPSG